MQVGIYILSMLVLYEIVGFLVTVPIVKMISY